MAAITAKLQGFESVDEMLGGLVRDFGPRNAAGVTNQPLRKAMEPIFNAIKRNTPIDAGDLAASTKLRVGRPNNRRQRTSQAVDEFTVSEARAGWFWNRSTDTVNSYQALAVEFGTEQSGGGQKVLTGALRSGAKQAISILGQELAPRIIKRARELAARKASGVLNIR